ncbi:molybdopterin molybdotransferase MoeA [Paracoccaceae bacterium]|nr:molybdopterin molybdotransferase MoeA [Paracoccaceae bacterium]
MNSQNFQLTSLSKLFLDLKTELKSVSGKTRVSVDNSVNRILSKDIFAKYDNPPFDNSAIDGFALNEDTKATIDNFSLLEGLVKPGCKATVALKKNEGIKILTGAPIPSGTTRIIFQENTKEEDQKIHFVQNDGKENNIRLQGEDFKKGDLLFKKGNQIKITDLAALIGSGHSSVPIVKPLKVGLITTGNELKSNIDKQSISSFIFDTNFVPLNRMIKSWGHSVVSIGSVGDNLDLLRDKIHDNLERVDVFVTTGGVSTGKEDFVAQFLNREAQVINWRIAIKPGRPFICAKLGTKYVFGLPGNPVAAFICALIILRPSLGRIGGEKSWFKPFSFKAKANFVKHKRSGRSEFLRANLNNEDGFVSIYPFEGSGRLSSLSWSNGLIKLNDSEQNIKKGDLINFIPYQSFF